MYQKKHGECFVPLICSVFVLNRGIEHCVENYKRDSVIYQCILKNAGAFCYQESRSLKKFSQFESKVNR